MIPTMSKTSRARPPIDTTTAISTVQSGGSGPEAGAVKGHIKTSCHTTTLLKTENVDLWGWWEAQQRLGTPDKSVRLVGKQVRQSQCRCLGAVNSARSTSLAVFYRSTGDPDWEAWSAALRALFSEVCRACRFSGFSAALSNMLKIYIEWKIKIYQLAF